MTPGLVNLVDNMVLLLELYTWVFESVDALLYAPSAFVNGGRVANYFRTIQRLSFVV